ncbi:hypothetical protein [Microbacterium maritypicum]|uniref:Uncharacterized protein n=1 Tax=Microbacterium maritypicum TaxID=33918 RepID=A0A4Y4B0V0_MICMQ|nr:hypothetical protein [Microbacterium liquefaciens]GEC74185.1 hypothetical protein MLI01_03300 [Microbacterium liquefaciens]GGV49522.1 hypothetical protein GCM10010213_03310 [Microbacterium liquefaciens]
MLTITSDTTSADASYLLGWALFELLDQEYPGRVRFPQTDEDWLRSPGNTVFVPVGDGTPVAEFARSALPTIQREITRQMEGPARSDTWFIEFDYWAHALSGDSDWIGDGLRFDVVVQVHP